jgi:signal transduction histidine kinase
LEYLSSIFIVKAQDKSIRLDFIVDESVPECLLVGDSHRLLQVQKLCNLSLFLLLLRFALISSKVLVNLVGNALKFTSRGFIEVSLKARTRHTTPEKDNTTNTSSLTPTTPSNNYTSPSINYSPELLIRPDPMAAALMSSNELDFPEDVSYNIFI